MRLGPVLLGTAGILLLAGAAAAATQASPEAPGLIGMFAVLLGCNDAFESALLARDALDEAEFTAVLDGWTDAGE